MALGAVAAGTAVVGKDIFSRFSAAIAAKGTTPQARFCPASFHIALTCCSTSLHSLLLIVYFFQTSSTFYLRQLAYCTLAERSKQLVVFDQIVSAFSLTCCNGLISLLPGHVIT